VCLIGASAQPGMKRWILDVNRWLADWLFASAWSVWSYTVRFLRSLR